MKLKEFTLDTTIYRSHFTNGFRGAVLITYSSDTQAFVVVDEVRTLVLSVEQNEYWPSFEAKVSCDS